MNETSIPKASKFSRREVPTVMQMEAVECGAACLLSIFEYHGKFFPLEQIRKECNVTREGASVFGITNVANQYGLLTEAHEVELKDLYDLPLPFIAYWNMNHFVVIEGFSKESVFIMDPSIGQISISYEDFKKSYSGLVILFEKSLDFTPSGQKTTIINSFLTIFERAKKPFIATFIINFILMAPLLLVPLMTQVFIDNFLINRIDHWQEEFILFALLFFGLMVGLKFLEQRILSRVQIFLTTYLSTQFLWHILRLPYEFYLQRYSGEITNRLQINENVSVGITTQLTGLVVDAILSIAFAAIMFYYDPLIANIGILFLVINLLLLRYLFKVKLNAYNIYQQTFSRVIGETYNLLDSIETIKASNSENKIFSYWAGHYTRNLNASKEAAQKDILAGTIPYFLQLFTSGIVLFLGAERVMSGDLSLGMLFAMILLMNFFTAPVIRLVNFNSVAELIRVDINRINDVLKNNIDKSFLLQEEHNDYQGAKLKGRIEIRNLTFGYDKEADPILKNINMTIQPGEMVGLVGFTASGKSTLVKLICGLLEPWEGEILFDGIPKNNLPRDLIIRSLGVAEQEVLLYSDTFKENIAFFDPTLSQETIVKAAKEACLHTEILQRTHGYDAMILQGGSNLSGGQRQKVEIARIFAKEPSIVIIDEALSNVDSESESSIIHNLRKKGFTLLVVAHRLSSTKLCDKIFVLENGEIIEMGSPQELMMGESIYRKFVELEKEIQKGSIT